MTPNYHLGGADSGDGTFLPDIFLDLVTTYSLRSVIDVGCACGRNTKWFLDYGLDAIGIEGFPEYIEHNDMPRDRLVLHDYTTGPYDPGRTFDLGWTSEFVEHVEAIYIPNFMATLVKCRNVCLTFATPGQGGYHHVNEQLEDYWLDVFNRYNFVLNTAKTAAYRATGPNTSYGRRTLTVFHNQSILV